MRSRRTVALAIVASLAGTPAIAQSPLLDAGAGPHLWLQVQRPSYARLFSDVGAWMADAGIALQLSSSTRLVVQLPFVMGTGLPSGATSNAVGNPFIGLRQTNGRGFIEAGVRPPLVSESASTPSAMGALADFDHFESYAPNLVSASMAGGTTTGAADNAEGMFGRFRLGASAWFPTKSTTSDNNQWLADYGASVGYRAGPIQVEAGVTGRYLINNADNADFGQRTVHQAVVGATWRRPGAQMRPTLFIRLPLDRDASDMYNSVIGVGVVLDLR